MRRLVRGSRGGVATTILHVHLGSYAPTHQGGFGERSSPGTNLGDLHARISPPLLGSSAVGSALGSRMVTRSGIPDVEESLLNHQQCDVNYREIRRTTVWTYEFRRRKDGRVPPAEGTRPYEKLPIPTDLAIVHFWLLVEESCP